MADVSKITVRVTVSRWRMMVSRLWIWALVLSEKTLPGLVDVEAKAQRMAAFVVRGVELKVVA